MDAQQVARFAALFAGNVRVYGTYEKIGLTERGDGKLYGEPKTKFGEVTEEIYGLHLAGRNGLGVVPIRDDNTCSFGAIDIDVYADLDHAAIAYGLKNLALPLIPCRSKSGGCHIYLFTKSPVPAATMQGKLREIAAVIGHGTAEVFPKQTQLDPEKKQQGAAWINLPYHNGDEGNRYAISATGDALALADFLAYAEASRVDAEWFTTRVAVNVAVAGKPGKVAKAEKDPIPDGPPCLNHLIQINFPVGTQDNGMFNLGIYARKAHPSTWGQWLQDANHKHVSPPIGPDDMRRIIGSLGKTEYKYSCNKDPLNLYCNAQQCRRRKYGVGDGTEVVVFGDMRKLLTAPPTWYWDVEIGEVRGTLELSTAELQDPMAVQRKCMEQLTASPAMPKRNDWIQTVQEALKKCTVMDALPEDSSIEGQFWQFVETFCTGRGQAFAIDEILMGKPYSNVDEGRTYFRMEDLMSFLKRMGFQEYKVNQAAKVLRGGESKYEVKHKAMTLKGRFVNLWSLNSFAAQTDGHDVPASITNDQAPY